MAVQFADNSLDEWMTRTLDYMHKNGSPDDFYQGYIQGLKDTQAHLHEFWGSALKED